MQDASEYTQFETELAKLLERFRTNVQIQADGKVIVDHLGNKTEFRPNVSAPTKKPLFKR